MRKPDLDSSVSVLFLGGGNSGLGQGPGNPTATEGVSPPEVVIDIM